MTESVEILLAGDIGGTKTNLAIYSSEAGVGAPVIEATFPSKNYPSLEAVADEFLNNVAGKGIARNQIERAVFGVAGPVVEGEAEITNLPWVMNEEHLAETLDISTVKLLNDLASIAQAVPQLDAADLHTLVNGESEPGGTIAVIAPGTGLGEAYLTWDGTRYRAYASEGGHTDFGPTNALQREMLAYLQERYDHVSYERVCSGMGLPNIYAFLRDSGYAQEPPELAAQLAGTKDWTPVIVNAAIERDKKYDLCVATLDMFVSILGAEAGNLALKVMSYGGVYIGGGIPPRIIPALEDGRFREAFLSKGRFNDLLERIPVHVILNPKSALIGAASYGFEL